MLLSVLGSQSVTLPMIRIIPTHPLHIWIEILHVRQQLLLFPFSKYQLEGFALHLSGLFYLSDATNGCEIVIENPVNLHPV